MTKRLPPLNALRVFEVAARRLNFTRAAEELHVTNAAVSHQIKLLEEHLDKQLFQRSNNVLRLTEAGERYLPRIREAFQVIQQATDTLLTDRTAILRVGVPPSFGSKWLVPRLYRFFNQHQDVRVEVVSEIELDYRKCDITIDFRGAKFADFCIEPFIATEVFPVCNPDLKKDIQTPGDLHKFTLLHEISALNNPDYPNWQRWFSELGISNANARQGPIFTLALLSLQAAIEGQGVALGQRALVEYDIAAGRLARLFDIHTSLRLHYYLVYAPDMKDNPAFQAFHQWLLNEAST